MYMSNELTALAIIPGLVLIGYVYGKDKVEKEPIGLIIKIIIFGVISCIAAGYLEAGAAMLLPKREEGTLAYAVQTSFCLAAFFEEIVKFLAMRIGSWKHPSFNYRFDGIVYGVSAAVGFAIYENVMYVSMYGFSTAIVRAFTAVPLHAFCGVFMGVFYSYSKHMSILGHKASSIKFTVLSLVVPMLIHGVYDTFAFLKTSEATMGLMTVVVVLYLTAIRTIKANAAADYRAGFYPQARNLEIDVDKY